MANLTYSEYLTQEIFKISSPLQKILHLIFVSLFGSSLLILSSKISFVLPFTPVPVTMQTFAVLLLSILLGRKVLYSLMLYLSLGIGGAPVFAKGGGILYLLGPTGGYLVGFLVAGYVCGVLAEQGYSRSFLRTFFVMFVGNIIIYFFGLLWLLRFTNYDFYKALYIGMLPFVVYDVLKTIIAAVILPLGWKVLLKNSG